MRVSVGRLSGRDEDRIRALPASRPTEQLVGPERWQREDGHRRDRDPGGLNGEVAPDRGPIDVRVALTLTKDDQHVAEVHDDERDDRGRHERQHLIVEALSGRLDAPRSRAAEAA